MAPPAGSKRSKQDIFNYYLFFRITSFGALLAEKLIFCKAYLIDIEFCVIIDTFCNTPSSVKI